FPSSGTIRGERAFARRDLRYNSRQLRATGGAHLWQVRSRQGFGAPGAGRFAWFAPVATDAPVERQDGAPKTPRGLYMATTQSQGKRRSAAATPSESGKDAATHARLGADALLDLYRKMVEIRLFEDAAQRGFRQGKVGGYMHVYSGQEAVATGFLEAYQEGDYIITA